MEKQYHVTLTGMSALLLHADDLEFSEKIQAWVKDPQNKGKTKPGDDRTPPWTWIGYIYDDDHTLGLGYNNIMAILREGGAKVKTGNKQETFKSITQSGVQLAQEQFDLTVDGHEIPLDPILGLIGIEDIAEHHRVVKSLGFELAIDHLPTNGGKKHVRVRPRFRDWAAHGILTVCDESQSGITQDVLTTILKYAGAKCGVGDNRPSSRNKSGPHGRFFPMVERI